MKSKAANKGKRRKRGRPAEGYSQVARVLALYERLRRHDVVNAVELAQDLNFSKRTIERDLCVLKELRDVRLEKVKEPRGGAQPSAALKAHGSTHSPTATLT